MREFTVKELVDLKKDEKESVVESFKAVDEIFESAESSRKSVINTLTKKSIAIYLKFFIRSVINTDLSIEIENLVGKLMANVKTAKEEKEILIALRNAISELKRYEITDCNPRIANILMLLYEKNLLLLKQAQKNIIMTNSRMKRLDVIEGTIEEDKISKIDSEVDSMVLSLGLNK